MNRYLDNILIYTENKWESHIEAIQWLLDQLWKYLLYANLKKYWFHQEKVRIFGYIIAHQGMWIKEKQIKAVCD